MKLRRFMSMCLTAVMLVSILISSASAVDINMSGVSTGYDAYRILNLTQSVKSGHSETGDCEFEGCDKANNPSGHYNYAYSLNEKYSSAIMSIIDEADTGMSDTEIISEIEKFDSDAIRAFADELYVLIQDLQPEYSISDSKFSDVEQGYYLIAEKSPAADGDSVSFVMLDTAGQDDITVTSKELNTPTVEKSVMQNTPLVFVGDEIWFNILCALPDNIDAYETYYLAVHDVLPDGLELLPSSIYVEAVSSEGVFVDISEDFYETLLNFTCADGCDLSVVFDDVKSFLTSCIRVNYKCRVTKNIQSVNTNTAHVEFSNDPYSDTRGTTLKVTETVYTVDLNVNKVDGSGNALSGAEFALYPYIRAGSSRPQSIVLTYDDVKDWSAEELGEWLDSLSWDEYFEFHDSLSAEQYRELFREENIDEIIYRANNYFGDFKVDFSSHYSCQMNSDGTSFKWNQLGSGFYLLRETKAPDGYQPCDDIIIYIGSIYGYETYGKDIPMEVCVLVYNASTKQFEQAYRGDEAMFNISNLSVSCNIVNESGIKLPSTGGAGVYYTCAVGLGLVLMGMVCLVVRRRREV